MCKCHWASETAGGKRQLHCSQIQHGWRSHTRSNNYVCVCIGYIYLAPLLCSACVCVLLQPHVCFNFSDTCAIKCCWRRCRRRSQLLPNRFVLMFFVYFSLLLSFCFLFGKGVYLSAVKTWLQTWNANANLVQSLHYADKPAKIFSFGLARRPPSFEISRERASSKERDGVFIKFSSEKKRLQKQLHPKCVTRPHNAVENCQINHSYLYKRPWYVSRAGLQI